MAKKGVSKKYKKFNKDFIYISIIIILVLAIAVVLFGSKQPVAGSKSYNIKNLTISTSVSLDKEKILKIASSDSEVESYTFGKQYSVEINAVTEEDKSKMPAVYSGLEGSLYKVTYRMEDMDLLVITNNEKVLKVLPITRLSIG